MSSEDRDTAKQQPPCSPVMGYDVMLQAHQLLRGQNSSVTDGEKNQSRSSSPDVIWVKNVRSTVACHATWIS